MIQKKKKDTMNELSDLYRQKTFEIPDGPKVILNIYKIPVNDITQESFKIFYKGANAGHFSI